MRRVLRVFLVGVLCVSLGGCFGSMVQRPAPTMPEAKKQLNVTLLWGLKPTVVETGCEHGVADVVQVWPAWGFAVSVLTFLLVMPIDTVYTCAAD